MPFIADSRSQTVATTLFVPMRLYAGLIFITSALIAMPDGSLWLAPAKAAVPASVIVSLQFLVGAALVAGAFTPYAALLGAFLTLNYMLMKGSTIWMPSNDPVFILGSLTVAAGAAGRAFGIDYFLHRRFPRLPAA